MQFDPSNYEPLVDDGRLEKVVHRLYSKYGPKDLADMEFVTFIQPAREVEQATDAGVRFRSWVPEMAIFAVLSPRPRGRAGSKLMSSGTTSLEAWREAEAEQAHFVDTRDHLFAIYSAVVADHIRKLDDLRSLIN